MLLAAMTVALAWLPLQHPGMTHQHGGMPFDQQAVEHHFKIEPAGGTIEIQVKPDASAGTLNAVRMHLKEIEKAFGRGDFSASIATHGETPAGVAQMIEYKDRLKYTYAEIPAGGRVTIRTTDRDALEAVHRFLRYQIEQHKTGDPIRVQ